MHTYHPGIIMLQETWCDTLPVGTSCLRSYQCFQAHSTEEPHRGLLTAISHSLPAVRQQLLWSVHGSILVIRVICRPPARDLLLVNYHGRHIHHDPERLQLLTDVVGRYPSHLVILAGDFNLHLSAAESQQLTSRLCLPLSTATATDFISTFMKSAKLTTGNYITSPLSRFSWRGLSSPSILDFVMLPADFPQSCYTMQTLPDFVGSDHIPLLGILSLSGYYRHKLVYTCNPLSPTTIRQEGENLNQALSAIPIPTRPNGSSDLKLSAINLALDAGVQTVFHRSILMPPALSVGFRHSTAGWPRSRLKIINKLKRCASSIQRSYNKTGWLSDDDFSYLTQLQQLFRAHCAVAKQEARALLEQKIHDLRHSDLSQFYKLAKAHSKNPSNRSQPNKLLNPAGDLVDGADANVLLATHFSSVTAFNRAIHTPTMVCHLASILLSPSPAVPNCTLTLPFSKRELHAALSYMKLRAVPGVDGVPVELLRVAPPHITSSYLELFNHILATHQVPDQWKSSILIPIPKKGDRSISSNWRGISLLCSSYKLFATLIACRLSHFLLTYSPLHWSQAGLEIVGVPLSILYHLKRSAQGDDFADIPLIFCSAILLQHLILSIRWLFKLHYTPIVSLWISSTSLSSCTRIRLV